MWWVAFQQELFLSFHPTLFPLSEIMKLDQFANNWILLKVQYIIILFQAEN